MNRVASALVTGGGIVTGAFLGVAFAETRGRNAQDAGALIGGLIGGMIAGAATADPAPKQVGVGVSGSPQLYTPRFP